MPGNVSRGPDCDRVAQGLHFPAGNPYLPPYGDGKMKKLMVLSALSAIAGGVLAASSGIVGYNAKATGGARYPVLGASFLPVDGAETYKLGTFVPTGMDPDADFLQVISPDTLAISTTYTYIDKATADAIAEEEGEEAGAYDELIGWWDSGIGVGEADAAAGDVIVHPGDGFVCAIDSFNEVTFSLPSATATLE